MAKMEKKAYPDGGKSWEGKTPPTSGAKRSLGGYVREAVFKTKRALKGKFRQSSDGMVKY